ncbi:MAG: cysteine desulfurase NifS [Anaerolineales bacterium]|nr:cysteine desulfurase [Anaerolineae bacterium]PWB53103.1 MAG: cysteine desulfurase NifS [Anaerolineales bacterium]
MLQKQGYLDYAATTPVDPRVMQAMLPFFNETFGNPSSIHRFGQAAEASLENARMTIAATMNCMPEEIIFTSCGTESDNLALRGSAFLARNNQGANHILISPVEHHAVSRTAEQLAKLHGFQIEYLPVDSYGRTTAEDVASCLRPDTAVVSVIFANNEIGTLNPIAEIGNLCRSRGVLFHTDAVQAAGYFRLDVNALSTDLISIGAHKFYGPKGVGALYVRKGLNLPPAQTGGSQEYGYRAGTQNIPYIVGMAEALLIAQTEKEERIIALKPLRDHLIGTVLEEIPDVQLTGHPDQRLPNHASFIFKGVDGNALLMMLDLEGFACSSGSACKTGSPEPSEVLTSLGFTQDWSLGSLRVTLGMYTTSAEIEAFLSVLPGVIDKLRQVR